MKISEFQLGKIVVKNEYSHEWWEELGVLVDIDTISKAWNDFTKINRIGFVVKWQDGHTEIVKPSDIKFYSEPSRDEVSNLHDGY